MLINIKKQVKESVSEESIEEKQIEKEVVENIEKSMPNTIPTLVTELQKYEPYQNLSKYYIDKELSKKYGVSSVKKSHYVDALNDIHQKEPSKKSPTTKSPTKPSSTQSSTKSPSKSSNKKLFILDDINIQFMLKLSYPDLLVYCQTDKHIHNLCKKNDLWNQLIARDFPFYLDDEPKAQKSYEHWYNYFDKYTLEIIAAFVSYRKKYTDLQKSYHTIFHILVKYVMENNTSMEQDDPYSYMHDVDQILYKEIFDSLGVPIKIEKRFTNMIPAYINKPDDETMYRYLSKIIYEMMMTYDDPA